MQRLNADWHRAHVMPKRATEAQRVKWHVAHAKHCACREMPPSIAALVAEGTATARKRVQRN